MTTEQSARERAQEQANATGKPWAVDPSGQHGLEAHQWGHSCSFEPACQRIDPAPAPSEGGTVREYRVRQFSLFSERELTPWDAVSLEDAEEIAREIDPRRRQFIEYRDVGPWTALAQESAP